MNIECMTIIRYDNHHNSIRTMNIVIVIVNYIAEEG